MRKKISVKNINLKDQIEELEKIKNEDTSLDESMMTEVKDIKEVDGNLVTIAI